MKPHILMFHRIELNNFQLIDKIYYERKMALNIRFVFNIIDRYLSKGYLFGSIRQCINSDKYFHLSFDDGFKEHFKLATMLKEKYNPPKNAISFSINIGNSIYQEYSGMDIVYELFKQKKINLLTNILNLNYNSTISEIKNKLLILSSNSLFDISNKLTNELTGLKDRFLSKEDVVKLSKLFSINSHGISHRSLMKYHKQSKTEIIESKQILEKLTGQKIETFCYPEGKNDNRIQNYVKLAGYRYGLSIRNEKSNNYCIGRRMPTPLPETSVLPKGFHSRFEL